MKDKIIIWGAKGLGRYAVRALQKERYEVAAIVDNCINVQGEKISGVTVISPENMKCELDKENTILVLTVMNSKNVFEVLEQAEEYGFKNIGILKPRAGRYGLRVRPDLKEEESEIIWYVKSDKKEQVIPRLEINLIDNCNLKCVGCTHFSSIYKAESILQYMQFVGELKQIRKIGKFVRIRLLGGEPLMVPELGQYITIARELFPETDIEIVTNGLLIPRLTKELLEMMRMCRISMVITPYKPTMQLKDQIRETLDSHEIWWNFDGDMITEFSRQFTLENSHNGYEASKKCISSGCLFLRNGKIYKCPIAGLANDFMNFYHLQTVPETGISIYDDIQKVYKEIKKCAKTPTAICNYCSEEVEMIPWQVNHEACLEEWLYSREIS